MTDERHQPDRPPFLDRLGQDLHTGRTRLSARRRRTNLAAGMAAVAGLAIGGSVVARNLTSDSPGEVATGEQQKDIGDYQDPSLGDDDESSGTSGPTIDEGGTLNEQIDGGSAPDLIRNLAAGLIGVEESEALDRVRREGFTADVDERDGEQFPVTDAIVPGRFHLSIEDGLVVKVLVEGEEPAGNLIIDEDGVVPTPLSVRELGNLLWGMPEDEALALIESEGRLVLIVERDGKALGQSGDLRLDRFLLSIADGVVSDVKFEAAPDAGTLTRPVPEQFALDLIGVREDEALALAFDNDLVARTVERDGQGRFGDDDLQPGRLNLFVFDNVVTKIQISGDGLLSTFVGLAGQPNSDAFAVIGVTEDAALDRFGSRARVVERDGQSLARTLDVVPGRLHLTVTDGRVTYVQVESTTSWSDVLTDSEVRLEEVVEQLIGLTEPEITDLALANGFGAFLEGTNMTGAALGERWVLFTLSEDDVVESIDLRFSRSYLSEVNLSLRGLSEFDALEALRDAGIPGGTISRDGESVIRTSEGFDQYILLTVVDGVVTSTQLKG